MIEENGRITELDGDYVWVEAERKSSCGSCAVNHGCGTSVLASVVGRKVSRVRVHNRVNAEPGDRVVIGIPDATLVQGSFAVYAVPLLSMLLCALLGEQLTTDPLRAEAVSIMAGVVGLGLGFVWLFYYGRRMASSQKHQPVILRKIWHLEAKSPV